MSTIQIEVSNKIARITLNRPPGNALIFEVYNELTDAFIELGERKDVAVIILRAEGKVFCGGNDLTEINNINNRMRAEASAEAITRTAKSIWNNKKIVIAAVQGHAMGAGMALCALSDFIIAKKGVLFGIPEVQIGIPAAGAFGALMLPMHLAKRFAFLGDPLPIEVFDQYGAIYKLCEDKEAVWKEAEILAERLANSCYLAANVFKQTFNSYYDPNIANKFLEEHRQFQDKILESKDFREAVDSYINKRPANFIGE